MLLLVAAIGWVVLRHSATSLDGEARQGWFTGWMCLFATQVILVARRRVRTHQDVGRFGAYYGVLVLLFRPQGLFGAKA